jgi:transmembrane sensor
MEDQRIQYLIDQVLSGTASPAEKEELDAWYREQNDGDVIWNMENANEEQQIENRGIKALTAHMKSSNTSGRVFSMKALLAVAAAVVGIGFAGYLFYNTLSGEKPARLIAKQIIAPVRGQENRYIVLPDSSVVLLHPGGNIKYAYNGKTREIYLSGEAYFNVKHLNNYPFKVHTQKVVTTVLGTSFNIKAYPNQNVTVSVTGGKVGVVDEVKKTTIMLTPNQQVTISADHANQVQKPVQAKKTIEWASTDMDFDQMPFFLLVDKMERRYGMHIVFENPGLKDCLITGRFDGTESLQKVLLTISETMGTTYTIKSDTIYINGAGCN